MRKYLSTDTHLDLVEIKYVYYIVYKVATVKSVIKSERWRVEARIAPIYTPSIPSSQTNQRLRIHA